MREQALTYYPLLAALLETPGAEFTGHLESARLGAPTAETSQALMAFAGALEGMTLAALQELHGATFEIAPPCIPYLSIHLFGEMNFKRSRLMTGLAEAYQAAGYDCGGELPDHLRLVLGFAPFCEPALWRDLITLCLVPAVAAMAAGMAGGINPYRHLIHAIELLLGADCAEEAIHA